MYRDELSDGKRVWQSGRVNKCLRNGAFTRRASGVDANSALLVVVVVEWISSVQLSVLNPFFYCTYPDHHIAMAARPTRARKQAKKGVQLTLMVVGQSPFRSPAHTARSLTHYTGASGTGRTTFVNTLVESFLLEHSTATLLSNPEDPHSALDISLVKQAAAQANVEQPIRIKPTNIELEEEGVRISLTVVDTPGFGDGIDNEYWWVVSFASWQSCWLMEGQLPRNLKLP